MKEQNIMNWQDLKFEPGAIERIAGAANEVFKAVANWLSAPYEELAGMYDYAVKSHNKNASLIQEDSRPAEATLHSGTDKHLMAEFKMEKRMLVKITRSEFEKKTDGKKEIFYSIAMEKNVDKNSGYAAMRRLGSPDIRTIRYKLVGNKPAIVK